jgi:exoribonuclease II
LVEAIRFNLVRQIPKARVFTDFFPGSHVPMMPLSSVSRNPQISLS